MKPVGVGGSADSFRDYNGLGEPGAAEGIDFWHTIFHFDGRRGAMGISKYISRRS